MIPQTTIMETSHIIGIGGMVAVFVWLIAFKVYRMQNHPTWKAIVAELRELAADKLLLWSLRAMPEGEEKKTFTRYVAARMERRIAETISEHLTRK